MASGTYPVRRTPGDAEVAIGSDGTVEVRSAGIDMGTGTYTILAQAAADVFGVPAAIIKVVLGDTRLPLAPLAGGSQLANLLVGAVNKAALATREQLLNLAADHPQSPLSGLSANDLVLADGRVRPARRPVGGVTIGDLLTAVGLPSLVVRADTFKPDATLEDRRLASNTFQRMQPPTDGGLSAHACASRSHGRA